MSAVVKTGAVLFAKDVEKVATFYERVVSLRRTNTAKDHVVLRSGSYELVVHALPAKVAESIVIDLPVTVREDSCLKLVFATSSISAARKSALHFGGLLNGRELEWRYDSVTVCDGCDPEGNVVQFRQQRVANTLKRRPAKKSTRASKRRR